LDALADSGQSDNSIVILTTDHGPPFPGMKSTLTDAGIGVGLLLRAPGRSQPGGICDALVSHIDLYPTICELAALDPPPWLQGRSLTPLLEKTAPAVRDAIFGEVTFHAAYEPQRAIRTQQWTYIRRFGERHSPVLPNIDASPALDYLLANGFADREIPSITLFDNALDPLQRENLAGTQSLATVEKDLSDRLETWMYATGDPLLAGPIELPPGATVNRAIDRSPDDPLVDTGFH
jgi:arylsulfatase A-like enzyme